MLYQLFYFLEASACFQKRNLCFAPRNKNEKNTYLRLSATLFPLGLEETHYICRQL